jgi:hypothetical protein
VPCSKPLIWLVCTSRGYRRNERAVCRNFELFTTSPMGTFATRYREIDGQICDFCPTLVSLMFYRCLRSLSRNREGIFTRQFLMLWDCIDRESLCETNQASDRADFFLLVPVNRMVHPLASGLGHRDSAISPDRTGTGPPLPRGAAGITSARKGERYPSGRSETILFPSFLLRFLSPLSRSIGLVFCSLDMAL